MKRAPTTGVAILATTVLAAPAPADVDTDFAIELHGHGM
jgi:hypothetical protein